MQQTTLTDNLKFPEDSRIYVGFFALGAIGLLLSVIGLFINTEQFFFSWLTSFSFIASIGLSALLFVMLQHATRSSWSVVLRRIPETMSSYLYILPVLFIPILFGMEFLYEWARPEIIATDELVQHKRPYLNFPFFLIRNVLYFAVWGYLGYKIYQNSIKLDETGNWDIDVSQRVLSAPGILIFSFTVAFASFDWLMSMDSHWFSTMFGVYFFSMSFQAFFATGILIFMYLRSKGLLLNTINRAHINDLGYLLFGFTVFYAYIAFSQFFLIYYANIPEETIWYYDRLQGNWSFLTYLFLIGRFIIPFVLLLGQEAKRNYKLLTAISVWLILLHFLEMHWIVMPVLHESLTFHWLDFAALLAMGGLFMGMFFNQFRKHSMVPKNDPLVIESLNKH